MVATNYISKVTKKLERFLIQKSEYRLTGLNYDLILFSPTDKYHPESKYSLILSSSIFDATHQKEAIKELFFYFKEHLSLDEYSLISRINILHSEDPFVKSMKSVFSFRVSEYEINDYPVAGVYIDFAYLIKSLVLDKLIEGKSVKMQIKENSNDPIFFEFINAGIIEIDKRYNVKYWTGKALREYFSPELNNSIEFINDVTSQAKKGLLSSQYVKSINLDDIVRIE